MWARKSSGVRKKYSTPFCSVPRGGRLVQEIEKCRSGTCVIKWLMSVLLPQPDGAENVSTLRWFSMVRREIKETSGMN